MTKQLKKIMKVVSKSSADLFANDDLIQLYSYGTLVLEYDRINNKVLSIYPASVTTTKAITQTKNYFGLDFDTHKEYRRLKNNGA